MHLTKAVETFDVAMVGEVAPRTRQWYAEHLEALIDHFGDIDLEEIDITGLREWRAALIQRDYRWKDHPTRPMQNSGLSPYTIAGYVRAVRRFFGWLYAEEILDHNPAQRLKPPRLPDTDPKAISQADLARILRAARESGARDYAVLCFLADTGCRLCEITGLRIDDLDLERMRAVVRGKGRGGQGKVRAVFFGKETARALKVYLEERHDPRGEDHLWLGRQGALTQWGISSIVCRLGKRAGVQGPHNPHSFRHAWARHALEAGASLGLVSQVLGHSNIHVTHDSYGRWAYNELGECARRYSPVQADF